MKQTILMLLLLGLGTAGAVVSGPFVGLAVYYVFAVLRPQYLWEWALLIELRWSLYVAAATIGATLVYLSSDSFRGRSFTPTHSAMLCFAFWVTLSNLFALNSAVSSQWYWEYLKIFAMFFCGALVVRKLTQVRILYLIIVGALGYIAFEVNNLYLFSARLDIYHYGFGGLDNNGAGLMIAMGIPMAYFLWQAYQQWWRWVFLAGIVLMVHAVLMTYSRGAMVSLLLSVPLLILRSSRKIQMIIAVVCFALVVPILAGEEIRARFFSVEQYEDDHGAQARMDSWNAAWQIAKSYPVFGVGLRNAEMLTPFYFAGWGARAIHSQYLQIAADSGFPAIAFYLSVLFGTWRGLRRTQKRCRNAASDDDWWAYNLACGLEGALVVFCVGAAFLSLEVFELPYLLILLGLQLFIIAQKEIVPEPALKAVPSVHFPSKLPA